MPEQYKCPCVEQDELMEQTRHYSWVCPGLSPIDVAFEMNPDAKSLDDIAGLIKDIKKLEILGQ